MINLQKTGAIAALTAALIYVCSFVFFGAIWNFPSDASVAQKFVFLKDNQTLLSIVNFVM